MDCIMTRELALDVAPSYAALNRCQQTDSLPDCSEQTLTSQLQTSLDIQQQLDIFSMYVGRVLNISGIRLNTAFGEHSAAGSTNSAHTYKSLLVLNQQCLAEVHYHSNQPFSPMQQRDLLLLESEWLFALRNALVVARLQQMALKDPLTALGNRRFFDDSFAKAIQLSRRRQQTCALLLLDLDNFKQLNDNYGHAMGDELLVVVADCMRDALRQTDSLFRFGGDEFAIILADEDADSADLVARRLLKAINQHYKCQQYGISASAGLAYLQPMQSAEQLFATADRALYEAKAAGKANLRQSARETLSGTTVNFATSQASNPPVTC
ncbi:GGDEF domain-containing protein [Arsukibacterium indicum]|uniref:diguanylate cyclase n=1 Tax=Arsukibacterium indicum TaxID=2848612 RepID=A0ABS6MIC5_9GAMM|nr:GGDEF domain-containing protein [Arsukibacterium indicum]MBV2128134.1 GGDEF domain-containing protein [Arsukibacterium indicum]